MVDANSSPNFARNSESPGVREGGGTGGKREVLARGRAVLVWAFTGAGTGVDAFCDKAASPFLWVAVAVGMTFGG